MVYNTGSMVGRVIATDRDQNGTDHVKIKYSLLNGLEFFNIHSQTGVITTRSNQLDREVSAALQ